MKSWWPAGKHFRFELTMLIHLKASIRTHFQWETLSDLYKRETLTGPEGLLSVLQFSLF